MASIEEVFSKFEKAEEESKLPPKSKSKSPVKSLTAEQFRRKLLKNRTILYSINLHKHLKGKKKKDRNAIIKNKLFNCARSHYKFPLLSYEQEYEPPKQQVFKEIERQVPKLWAVENMLYVMNVVYRQDTLKELKDIHKLILSKYPRVNKHNIYQRIGRDSTPEDVVAVFIQEALSSHPEKSTQIAYDFDLNLSHREKLVDPSIVLDAELMKTYRKFAKIVKPKTNNDIYALIKIILFKIAKNTAKDSENIIDNNYMVSASKYRNEYNLFRTKLKNTFPNIIR